MKLLVPALAAAGLALPAPATAAIVVATGAPGVNTDENVLFKNLGPSGTIVTSTNKDTLVTFTGDEILDATAGGQAKITGADGDLTTLNFFLTDPAATMSAVEFSLSRPNGRSAEDALATIRFFDQFGVATTFENAPLNTGQSWFAAYVTMQSAISRVEISTSAAIRDVRHVRITTANAAAAVPEPASWLMLIIGFGMAGAAMRRRHRRAATWKAGFTAGANRPPRAEAV